MDISTAAAIFSDLVAEAEWLNGKGSYFAYSFCQDRGSSTVICEDAIGIEGEVGEVQYCGGTCVMVYLGSQEDDSCGTGEERRFYESVCKDDGIGNYAIYQLAFTDFEVRYVAVINGTAWSLWEEHPADMSLSVESLKLANPFEGYEMALQGSDYSTAYASQSAMSVTNCNGYCGFARVAEGDLRMTMHGSCVTPSDGCTSGSSTCTATVQSFDQSRAGDKLPVTVSGAVLRYNGTNVIAQYSASAIPLKGRVEFSVPNTERVLPSEAATDVNGIMTTLLPQDANHEDVVVVYTDGAVATASRDCAFTLLETRDKNRMYSMRNVRNVTECDLLVSNGASERSLSVAAQTTKNSGAVPVANATALWPAHPPGSESRSSGLSTGAKIGIGVGVPVGVIVIACAIVLIVCRRRRKKEAQPLPSEEVAEPPKEGNPLVHPVANTEDNPTPANAAVETQSNVEPVAREAVAAPVESVVQEVAAPPAQNARSELPSAPIPAAVTAGLVQNAAPSKTKPRTKSTPVPKATQKAAPPKKKAEAKPVPTTTEPEASATSQGVRRARHDWDSMLGMSWEKHAPPEIMDAYYKTHKRFTFVPLSNASPSGTGAGNDANTQSVPPRSLPPRSPPATAEASQWTNVPKPPEVKPQNRTTQAKPSTRSPQLHRTSSTALNSSQFSEPRTGEYYGMDSFRELAGFTSDYSCFRDSDTDRGVGGGTTTTTQVTVSSQPANPRNGAVSPPYKPRAEYWSSLSSDSVRSGNDNARPAEQQLTPMYSLLDNFCRTVGPIQAPVETQAKAQEVNSARGSVSKPAIDPPGTGSWRTHRAPALPSPVEVSLHNMQGDLSKPEPPCTCIGGTGPYDTRIFCGNHHMGEWGQFDVLNYYDPSIVYKGVWFPLELTTSAVWSYFRSNYKRMAADKELHDGHGDAAAVRAVHKAENDKDNFKKERRYRVFYGDRCVNNPPITFEQLARGTTRLPFSIRKSHNNDVPSDGDSTSSL